MHKTLLTMAILLAGCVDLKLAPEPSPSVDHVVLCWLQQPHNLTDCTKLIDTSYEFAKIPGVVRVRCGRPIPSTRPVVDSSFDIGIVITFLNIHALDDYEQNPIHKKAVSDVLKPLTAKILIYDIERAYPSPTKR
jgi:hypothetical protein